MKKFFVSNNFHSHIWLFLKIKNNYKHLKEYARMKFCEQRGNRSVEREAM